MNTRKITLDQAIEACDTISRIPYIHKKSGIEALQVEQDLYIYLGCLYAKSDAEPAAIEHVNWCKRKVTDELEEAKCTAPDLFEQYQLRRAGNANSL